MSNTLKIIIAAIALIGLAFFGYSYSGSNKNDSSGSALQSSSASQSIPGVSDQDAAVSDKFLGLLLNMKNIKFDQSIFSNPSFTLLKDFSTVIRPEGNEGRANPFAPVGQDVLQDVQTFSVTTSPVAPITTTAATFVGQLDPGVIAQERYFEYGLQANPPLPNITAKVQQSVTTGAFTFPITNLTPNTTYYVRAVAKIAGVTYYGSVVSFKTNAQ